MSVCSAVDETTRVPWHPRRIQTSKLFRFSVVVTLALTGDAQPDVCGRSCSSDVDCPDSRGVCTYCTKGVCQSAPTTCGAPPSRTATGKPELLVVSSNTACLRRWRSRCTNGVAQHAQHEYLAMREATCVWRPAWFCDEHDSRCISLPIDR